MSDRWIGVTGNDSRDWTFGRKVLILMASRALVAAPGAGEAATKRVIEA